MSRNCQRQLTLDDEDDDEGSDETDDDDDGKVDSMEDAQTKCTVWMFWSGLN